MKPIEEEEAIQKTGTGKEYASGDTGQKLNSSKGADVPHPNEEEAEMGSKIGLV